MLEAWKDFHMKRDQKAWNWLDWKQITTNLLFHNKRTGGIQWNWKTAHLKRRNTFLYNYNLSTEPQNITTAKNLPLEREDIYMDAEDIFR